MKIILTLVLSIYAIYSFGQTATGQEASEYSCNCSKKALTNNKVNVTLLEEINKDYQSLSYSDFNKKHKSDVDIVYRQIKDNFSKIKSSLETCRTLWKKKYQYTYQSDSNFRIAFQDGLLKCHAVQGIDLLQKLKGDF